MRLAIAILWIKVLHTPEMRARDQPISINWFWFVCIVNSSFNVLRKTIDFIPQFYCRYTHRKTTNISFSSILSQIKPILHRKQPITLRFDYIDINKAFSNVCCPSQFGTSFHFNGKMIMSLFLFVEWITRHFDIVQSLFIFFCKKGLQI